MNEEEQKEEQLQESFEEIEQGTAEPVETETVEREETEEAAAEPQPEETVEAETVEESPTGGEIPKTVEQQPTQMFIAKKRDEEKEAKQSRLERLKTYITECKRVLKVTKKPDRTEFKTIVKVSGIGILIIGVIGFIINMFKELFF